MRIGKQFNSHSLFFSKSVAWPPVDSKAQDPPLPLPLHKTSFHSFLHVTPTSISFIQANHTTKPSTLELGCSLVVSGREKGYIFAEQ